jgi:hypothetical protein
LVILAIALAIGTETVARGSALSKTADVERHGMLKLATITQLPNYLSWRDAKTAVLLSNRNKDFSGVLENGRGADVTEDAQKNLLEGGRFRKFPPLAN